MQVVILAAGKGTRMGRLTEDTPKPMLTVSGKTLLEHKFYVLPEVVDEIILIVGYRKEMIQAAYGDSYKGKKVAYVVQENPVGGTAAALWCARNLLRDRFLVMMGDDIYSREDIEACLLHDWAILAARVPDTSVGGALLSENGRLVDIVEHARAEAGLVNTNMFVLDTRVFAVDPVPKAPGSTELGLPQTVLVASQKLSVPLEVVEATRWIQITDPADLKRAERILSTDGSYR